MTTIMPAFGRPFTAQGSIIGRLLAGYGELELELCFCATAARNDFNMVFKAMFRPRGESQRIQIADAIAREPFHEKKLGTLFDETIGAVAFCLKIRNQYAHCYWTTDFGKQLGFVVMEETARDNKRVDNVLALKTRHLDAKTLKAQEAYFVHTRDCLRYLAGEFNLRAGRSASRRYAIPKKVMRPNLYSP